MKGGSTKRRSLLGLLLILILTLNQAMASHHRVLRRIYLPTAVEMARKSHCREPQPRAYNLRDLLHDIPSENVNQPVYIVLNRCDGHAGCCLSPDLSCSPVVSSIYYEDIEVEVWSLLTNSTRKIWIRVEQHAKCKCRINSTSERHTMEVGSPRIRVLDDLEGIWSYDSALNSNEVWNATASASN